MPDFIPVRDLPFDGFQAQLVDYANANLAALGLVAADLIEVQATRAEWDPAFDQHRTIRQQARAAAQTKRSARKKHQDALRRLAARIRSYPGVTNGQLSALGLTVPGAAPAPSARLDSYPLASVDSGERFLHRLRWRDSDSKRRTKPRGVFGAQIFIQIGGAPPVGIEGMSLLGIATASRFMVNFSGPDAGKTAHYILRWIRRADGSGAGPLAETVSATIGG